MNHLLKYAVGIDVSKDKIDVCMSAINPEQKVTIKATSKFANTVSGFTQLQKWVQQHHKDSAVALVYAMEATGVYYENLAWYLYEQGCKVSVILPKKAKHYFKSLGIKSKNDRIDAQGLAQMAAEKSLRFWQPLSPQIAQLRALTRHHDALQNQITVFGNQLHALVHSHTEAETVESSIQTILKTLKAQLHDTQQQIEQVIQKDEKLRAKYALIAELRGVAVLTFATLVAETNGFELFENQRQLVSYAGYDVKERQSGKYVGQPKISKQGNARIRKVLYLPALNVVRYQQKPFQQVYERIYQKNPQFKMKGYVAVQRKLLVLIYTLWKTDQAYDPNKIAPTSEATQDEVLALLLH
jgi:transposase